MSTARSLPYGGCLSKVVLCQGDPQTETPRWNIGPETETPWKEHGTRDRDPLEATWDQRQRPPGSNMGPETETTQEVTLTQRQRPLEWTWNQAARQEVTLYRDTPPLNRITDRCKNTTFPQLCLLAVKMQCHTIFKLCSQEVEMESNIFGENCLDRLPVPSL